MAKKKKRKQRLLKWFSDHYGLDSEKAIKQLGSVKVGGSLYPYSDDWFFDLPLRERRRALKKWRKKLFKRLVRKYQLANIECFPKGEFCTFICDVPAKHLLELMVMRDLYVDPLELAGKEKDAACKKREWYAVWSRYAIQVEGATKGKQGYEDRVVLVKAKSFEQAEKRVRNAAKRYARPYLNSKGRMVRWQLERIIDVYDTEITTSGFDPKGTEVFSRLKTRKMKRKYEWHPHGED